MRIVIGLKRALSVAAVPALLIATAGACADSSRSGSAGAPGPTTSHAVASAPTAKTFAPYAADGQLAVPVADHVQGYCWTSSIAVPVPDAYRCLAGNAILDPCFAPRVATPTTVACVADPWSPAHVVTLTKELPAGWSSPRAAAPWAIELANGAHCVAVTGTVPSVDGVSLNYFCGDSMAAGSLTQAATGATVKYGPQAGGTLSTVSVTTLWQATAHSS